MLEALGAAVVGVGDFGIRMLDAVVAEAFDFVAVHIVGDAFEIGEVFVVHGEDEIEFIEVLGGDLASGAGHGEAAFAPGGAHTRVGRVAGVVSDGAGGVAEDFVAQTGVIEQLFHDVFA